MFIDLVFHKIQELIWRRVGKNSFYSFKVDCIKNILDEKHGGYQFLLNISFVVLPWLSSFTRVLNSDSKVIW